MPYTEELKGKVDELRTIIYELKLQVALIEQRSLAQENVVRITMDDQRAKNDALEKRIDEGFRSLRADYTSLHEDNAEQTAIISKWGTVRDTLLYVGIGISTLIGAIWTFFVWFTGHK